MTITKSKKIWLSAIVLITLAFGSFYVTVQQSLRYAADDPQSSMAQDVAAKLEQGANPKDLVSGRIDMSQDAAPFIIIYDQYGKVVAGNGYLNNKIPQVPIGVLAATKGHKINTVTWAPEAKVRIASVSVQAGDNNYVLGGRSLSYVEFKIKSLTDWVTAIWAIIMALILLAYYKVSRHSKKTEADSSE